MDRRRVMFLSIAVLLVGLITIGASYAFFAWTSSNDKSVFLNIAKDLKEYIDYSDGESEFIGDFGVSNSYTGGIHTTISVKKREGTPSVDLVATINMDVRKIGTNMANSTALKWVITSGNASASGDILGQGNFVGLTNNSTITLLPIVEVTEQLKEFTIWIWLDASEYPSDILTGETLDTAVWMQVSQLDSIDEIYEITRVNAYYQTISATVINNTNVVTDYAIVNHDRGITSWENIPEIEKQHIPSNKQNNIFNLVDKEIVDDIGTYDVWFNAAYDNTNHAIYRSVVVDSIDTTAPICSFSNFNKDTIGDDEMAIILLNCIDNESLITISDITQNSLLTSSAIIITNVTKTAIENGYQYQIRVVGTNNDGVATITLPANTIRNAMQLGNGVTVSTDSINVANYIDLSDAEVTLSQNSYMYDGNPKTPNVTVIKDGNTLNQNVDYTVSYSNNINGGEATVKITGINEYGGIVTKSFTIIYNTYTVAFASIADCPLGSEYNSVNTTYNTPFNKANPTCVGYTFAGWTATNLNTGTAVYGNSSNPTTSWSNGSNLSLGTWFKNLTMTQGATVTLAANWTANTYTISYTCNNGTCNGPTNGVYGSDVQINNPTKIVTIVGDANGTGATVGASTSASQIFAGWTSTTLGGNAMYGAHENPTTAWTGTTTKFAYFKNLREDGTVTMIANWTPKAVVLPEINKEGYACKWYDAATGGNFLGYAGDTYMPTANSATTIKVYADCIVKSTLQYRTCNSTNSYCYNNMLKYLSTNIFVNQIESVIISNSLEGHTVDNTTCWDVGASKNGTVLAWATDEDNNGMKEITIGSVGKVIANNDSSNLFYFLPSTRSILNLENLDTSNVTNMYGMFSAPNGDSNLVTLDVSNFDTSNVTNMTYMFSGIGRVTSVGDLSNWNTSKVTSMERMFNSAYNLLNLDSLSNWDVSNVINMSGMFFSTNHLTSLDLNNWNTSNVENMIYMFSYDDNLINLNVSNWNTSRVQNMYAMFYNAFNLKSLDLSNWDVSNVTSMSDMFYQANNLISVGNLNNWNTSKLNNIYMIFYNAFNLKTLDLTNWDTSNITTMYDAFWRNYNLTSIGDLSNWNTSNVKSMTSMFEDTYNLSSVGNLDNWDLSNITGTNMIRMFRSASNLKTLGDISNWNISKVTSLYDIFTYTTNLATIGNLDNWDTSNVTTVTNLFRSSGINNLDISNWNTSKLQSTFNMFSFANKLTTVGNLSNWDTTNITNMSNMFFSTSNLTTPGDLSNWNTSKVQDMSQMFESVGLITIGNLNNWDVSNVTNMYGMFAGPNLTSIGDLSTWNTSKVTYMGAMFYTARSLTALNLSNWNTSKVTSMASMFWNATNLTTIGDVSNWNTSKVNSMSYMFTEMKSLLALNLSNWNTANVTTMYNMFHNVNKVTTLNLSNFNTAKVTSMYGMFYNNNNLTTIYVGNSWNTNKVSNATNMFWNIKKIVGGAGTTYNSSQVSNKTYARIDGGNGAPGYFTAAVVEGAKGASANLLKTVSLSKPSVNINSSYDDLRECNNSCGTTCLSSGDSYICPSYSCDSGLLSGTNCYVY